MLRAVLGSHASPKSHSVRSDAPDCWDRARLRSPCRARRVGGSPTKQLIEPGAKGERYARHRKRHWARSDPRQLKLPFIDGDGQ